MHDEAFRTLLASNTPNGILSMLTESFYSDLLAAFPKDNHLTDREKQLLYLFIVGGVNAVEQDWIQNDRDIKEENHFLDAMVQTLIHIEKKSLCK